MFRKLSVLIFVLFFISGISILYGFIFDNGSSDHKIIIGLAVVLGWFLVIISTVSYTITTFKWLIYGGNWYWESFYPVNFSFVLWVISLFEYNINMGFLDGIFILLLSVPTAFIVGYFQFHKKKLFLLIVPVCFISNVNYLVPLFVGSIFFLISISEIIRSQKIRGQS